MVAETRIELLTPDDWPAVRTIYAAGIATGQATFETDVYKRQTYAHWYNHTHPAPALLAEAVYGLTEVCRAELPCLLYTSSAGPFRAGSCVV